MIGTLPNVVLVSVIYQVVFLINKKYINHHLQLYAEAPPAPLEQTLRLYVFHTSDYFHLLQCVTQVTNLRQFIKKF